MFRNPAKAHEATMPMSGYINDPAHLLLLVTQERGDYTADFSVAPDFQPFGNLLQRVSGLMKCSIS
jgi:hypothetical protein